MKILFIGDGYPVGKEAGSLLYRRLLISYGINNCCYYGIGYKTILKWPEEFEKMPKQNSSLRIWPRGRIFKYFRKIPIIEELFYFMLIPVIGKKIRRFALINNVALIIAVFRADVLAIINNFDKKHEFPILGYISDTVEAEYSDKSVIYKYKRREYLKAIDNAKGLYVAGEAMYGYIKDRYCKNTIILRLGYESNFNIKKKIWTNEKEIRIFFSGSVYAKYELEIFVKALSAFASKYPDYKVIFIMATNYTIKTKPFGVKIMHLGWLDEQELVSIMQNAQIGYVPYKFDKNSETQMRYAFPSKLGFYLSTNLPVFFHGPSYSSIIPFFEKYPCGIHCDSLNESEITGYLEEILFDRTFYNNCILAGIEAFKKEFSLSVLESNFKVLINYALNNR